MQYTMKKIIITCFILSSVISLSAQTNIIGSTGPVGIGTTSPIAGSYLHVYRSAAGQYNPLIMLQDGLSGGFTQFGIKGTGRTFHFGVGNTGAAFGLSNRFFIWDQNAVLPRLVIDENGTVGIGTTDINNSYKLFVEGAIRARKLKIDQTAWPDYVFATNYPLLPLPELQRFIQTHHHLPDVPSAAEVEKEGLDVGSTQAALLKKIEELTLHLIEVNRQVQEQAALLKTLTNK